MPTSATFLCRCLQNRSREGCKTDHEMLQNRSLHVTVVLTLLVLCEVTVELQIRDRICTQKAHRSKMMCHRDTCAEAGRSAERPIHDNDHHPPLNSPLNWFLTAVLSKGLGYRHRMHEYYALASLIFCAILVSTAPSIIYLWMIRT